MATAQLCTVQEVLYSPAFKGMRNNVDEDENDIEYIELSIKSVSDRSEKLAQRKLARATYSDVFSIANDHTSVIAVRNPPISSITSIKEEYNGDFQNGSTLDPTSYSVVDDGESGVIRLRDYCFQKGVGCVQVTYVGGYDPIPDDLKKAAIEQVCYEFRVNPNHGMRSEQQIGSQTVYTPLELLKYVREVFQSYRVVRF